MRIISFSADGIINAAENGFYDWLNEQDADFICVQDLRCSEYDLQDNKYFPQDYNAYFLDDIDGKSNGVAIYCRKLPKAIMRAWASLTLIWKAATSRPTTRT